MSAHAITLRPEVAAFATLMEQRLRANEHKGGWKNDRPATLFRRVNDEAYELWEAINEDRPDAEAIGREAADLANFAMMVADVMGALPPERETFDYDISNDGVMTALPTWQRNNASTFLRLMLVCGHATTEADVAGWTDEQCQLADIWAWTTHLSAGDHDDIKVPARPAFLTPGNHAANRHPITGEPE